MQTEGGSEHGILHFVNPKFQLLHPKPLNLKPFGCRDALTLFPIQRPKSERGIGRCLELSEMLLPAFRDSLYPKP